MPAIATRMQLASSPAMSNDAPIVAPAASKRKRRPEYAVFTENNDWEGEVWHFYFAATGYRLQMKQFAKDLDAMAALYIVEAFPYELDMRPIKESEVDVLVKHCDSDGGYMASHQKLEGRFDYATAKERIVVERATEEFAYRLKEKKLAGICDPTSNEHPPENYVVFRPYRDTTVYVQWEGNEEQLRLLRRNLGASGDELDLGKKLARLDADPSATIVTGRLMYVEFLQKARESGVRYVYEALYKGGFRSLFS